VSLEGPSRDCCCEEVADRLTIDEFGLYLPQHVTLPCKRNHGQYFVEGNPTKLAVFVIDDHGRLGLRQREIASTPNSSR